MEPENVNMFTFSFFNNNSAVLRTRFGYVADIFQKHVVHIWASFNHPRESNSFWIPSFYFFDLCTVALKILIVIVALSNHRVQRPRFSSKSKLSTRFAFNFPIKGNASIHSQFAWHRSSIISLRPFLPFHFITTCIFFYARPPLASSITCLLKLPTQNRWACSYFPHFTRKRSLFWHIYRRSCMIPTWDCLLSIVAAIVRWAKNVVPRPLLIIWGAR